MTMTPIFKKCPLCHKKYAWNPDVGNFSCPYCGGLKIPKNNPLELLFKKKDTSDKYKK